MVVTKTLRAAAGWLELGLADEALNELQALPAEVQRLRAALELKLTHLAGLHKRVEQVTEPYNVICSRAFASLGDFTKWSAAALAPGGVWMAMKGKHPASEIDMLDKAIEVFHVEQLTVPGLDAERCIVWARPEPASII